MYLDEKGVLENGYDIVHPSELRSAFTPELLSVLNTLLLSEIEFRNLRNKGTLPKPKITLEAAGVLASVLKARRAEYATSIDKDKAILADDNLPYRTRMAVEVRLGEKMVFQMAQEELSKIQKNLQREAKPSQKRAAPNGELIGSSKKTKSA